jgi:HemY protein
MWRFLFALILIAALSLGAIWLMDQPGRVALSVPGLAIEMPIGVFAALAIFALALVAGLYSLWRRLRALPGRLREKSRDRRQRAGYASFAQGILAAASGDANETLKFARKTEKLLHNSALSLLLSAQAAQLSGDKTGAESAYRALAETGDAAFLGLRGLYGLAVRAGDQGKALAYARRALGLKPTSPWALNALFELEVEASDWEGAEATLREGARLGVIEDDRRKRAILAYARARAVGASDIKAACALAKRAYSLAPEFAPFAAYLSESRSLGGQNWRAMRTLAKAWAKAPHPVLTEAFFKIAPALDPSAKLKKAQVLAAMHPDDAESRLLVARAALAAGNFALARSSLEKQTGARAYRLLAELDGKEYGDAAGAAKWLGLAEAAPDPAWSCRRCHHSAADWQPKCPACGAFDALAWSLERRPPVLPAYPRPERTAESEAPPPLPLPGD